MIFQEEIVGTSRTAASHYDDIQYSREMANNAENAFYRADTRRLAVNDGFIPRDLYQEFENVTVTRFRADDGDTFLNDLLPMSRSVGLGTMINIFRKASDAGNAQTSMTGQTGVNIDQVEYTYAKDLIPIHDAGFGRNFREVLSHTAGGFDALVDDQRENVATVRRKVVDSFMDGHKHKNGNFIVMDSVSWQGMRNDARVLQVTLVFDFTDITQTFAAIEAAFKLEVRDPLWIGQKCQKEATYYVSQEIMSVWEKNSSENDGGLGKVLQRMASLQGVKEIKVSSKLSGNELMGYPLDSESVRPLVGMSINTVAMPRPFYNSNHNFTTWGAIGFQVKNDFAGNTCAVMAQ